MEESSAGWQSPYYFNSKELDEETGLYYYGARYLNPTEARWLSVDPMFEKYAGMSPYNYCMGNPVKLVDVDGRDIYVFDENGDYSHKITKEGEHTGLWLGNENRKERTFKFADSKNDPKDIEDGIINKIVSVSVEKVAEIIGNAGVFEQTNKDSEWKYLNTESKGGGKLDFSYSGIPLVFIEDGASFDPLHYPSPILFLPEGDEYAHNHMNFGNFLWGASGHTLGFSKITLLLGAHYNSIFNSITNAYDPQFDSKDDQLSISRGVEFSKQNLFRECTWSQNSGLNLPKKRK